MTIHIYIYIKIGNKIQKTIITIIHDGEVSSTNAKVLLTAAPVCTVLWRWWPQDGGLKQDTSGNQKPRHLQRHQGQWIVLHDRLLCSSPSCLQTRGRFPQATLYCQLPALHLTALTQTAAHALRHPRRSLRFSHLNAFWIIQKAKAVFLIPPTTTSTCVL